MGNPITVNDSFSVVVQSIYPNRTITICRHKLCYARKPVLLHNMARPLSAPGIPQLTLGRGFKPTRLNLADFKPFIRRTGGRHSRKWFSIIKSGRNELGVAMRKIRHVIDDIQCHRTTRRTREGRLATCSAHKRVSHVHTAFSNGYNGWSGLKDVCLNHLILANHQDRPGPLGNQYLPATSPRRIQQVQQPSECTSAFVRRGVSAHHRD